MTTVYRKPNHTDQYLNFDSNHPLIVKLGVARTLYSRARKLCSSQADRRIEESQIYRALEYNGYSVWIRYRAMKLADRPLRER